MYPACNETASTTCEVHFRGMGCLAFFSGCVFTGGGWKAQSSQVTLFSGIFLALGKVFFMTFLYSALLVYNRILNLLIAEVIIDQGKG